MPTYSITRRWTIQEYFTTQADTLDDAVAEIDAKEPPVSQKSQDIESFYEGVRIENLDTEQIELDFGENFEV